MAQEESAEATWASSISQLLNKSTNANLLFIRKIVDNETSNDVIKKDCDILEELSSLYLGSVVNPLISLTSNMVRKRNELIYIEKLLLKWNHIRILKKTLGPELRNISLNSKFSFPHPQINLHFTLYDSNVGAKWVNAITDRQLPDHCLRTDFTFEYNPFCSLLKVLDLKENDFLYKVYDVRIGHLLGSNKNVLFVLSSKNVFIFDVILHKVICSIPYEDITTLIIGAFYRWLCILSSRGILPYILYDSLQIEFNDYETSLQVLQHLEISIRRQLIHSQKDPSTFQNSSQTKSVLLLEKELVLDHKFHWPSSVMVLWSSVSLSRRLEPLLPSILFYSSKEIRFFKKCISEQLKLKDLPLIIGGWLVLYQSSDAFYREENRFFSSLNIEGHLMVFNSLHGNSWTPAYFVIKCGVLYQFENQCSRLPQHVIKVNEFCGCQRLPSESRPYSFELIRKDSHVLKFAAPNEEEASMWLQSFMTQMISKGESSQNNFEQFVPCQLLLTDEYIILSHQKSFFGHPFVITKKHDSEIHDLNVDDVFSSVRRDPNLIHSSNTIDKSPCISSTSRACALSSTEFSLQCDNNRGYKDNLFGIFSSCAISQIAEMFYSSVEECCCFVELKCNEATELGSDWVIYFHSSAQFGDFLNDVVAIARKSRDNSPILKQVSSGRMTSLLKENAARARKYWRPF